MTAAKDDRAEARATSLAEVVVARVRSLLRRRPAIGVGGPDLTILASVPAIVAATFLVAAVVQERRNARFRSDHAAALLAVRTARAAAERWASAAPLVRASTLSAELADLSRDLPPAAAIRLVVRGADGRVRAEVEGPDLDQLFQAFAGRPRDLPRWRVVDENLNGTGARATLERAP